MTDATTFILIAGLAFFFFLAPSKNFKQAFQALAFVLFIGLAIMTLSTDELTITETNVITHDYTDRTIDMIESFELDFTDKSIADNWEFWHHQADTTRNLSVEHNARNDMIRVFDRPGLKENMLQLEGISKPITAPGLIKSISITLQPYEIPGITSHEILAICPVPFTCFAGNIPQTPTILDPIRFGSEEHNHPRAQTTITFDLTQHPSYAGKDTVYLTYQQLVGQAAVKDTNPIKILDITAINVTYSPPPAIMLEGSNHTTTLTLINFGEMNIAIGFIFVFLAMINLMIFMIDVVTWKRKTNSKTL